jgi:hypothetical protein
MFNFTTQTILNKLSKKTSENPKGNLIVDQQAPNNSPKARIGNLRFNSPKVVSIEKKKPTPEVLATATFDLTAPSATDWGLDENITKASARFAFYIGLTQTSVDSFYANDLVYKGKPIYIEFPVTLSSGKVTSFGDEDKAAFEKSAKFVLNTDAEQEILKYAVDGTTITFTAVNGYQIIRQANLEVFDPALTAIDCCSVEGGFKKVAAGTITEGAEAFGDYAWIMHNLRLPTCANTSYWGITKAMDELPVVNGTYYQYTIVVEEERPNIGGMVVGEVCTSRTTHVLYVAKPFASAVQTELAKFGTIKVDADTKLQAPFV